MPVCGWSARGRRPVAMVARRDQIESSPFVTAAVMSGEPDEIARGARSHVVVAQYIPNSTMSSLWARLTSRAQKPKVRLTLPSPLCVTRNPTPQCDKALTSL